MSGKILNSRRLNLASDKPSLKQLIEQDLKTALLAGDKVSATTLRGLKSVILNAEIASGNRGSGLGDQETISLLAKEAKMRQESADLYIQGNEQSRANAELKEKSLIEKYLPKQLSDEELKIIVDAAAQEKGINDMKQMGQLIGAVKEKAGASADGSTIARLVKEKLAK